jgi:hypothetical protein
MVAGEVAQSREGGEGGGLGDRELAGRGLEGCSCRADAERAAVSRGAAAEGLGGTGDLLIAIFALVTTELRARGGTAERDM